MIGVSILPDSASTRPLSDNDWGFQATALVTQCLLQEPPCKLSPIQLSRALRLSISFSCEVLTSTAPVLYSDDVQGGGSYGTIVHIGKSEEATGRQLL